VQAGQRALRRRFCDSFEDLVALLISQVGDVAGWWWQSAKRKYQLDCTLVSTVAGKW